MRRYETLRACGDTVKATAFRVSRARATYSWVLPGKEVHDENQPIHGHNCVDSSVAALHNACHNRIRPSHNPNLIARRIRSPFSTSVQVPEQSVWPDRSMFEDTADAVRPYMSRDEARYLDHNKCLSHLFGKPATTPDWTTITEPVVGRARNSSPCLRLSAAETRKDSRSR
jgi:hypothetical protein